MMRAAAFLSLVLLLAVACGSPRRTGATPAAAPEPSPSPAARSTLEATVAPSPKPPPPATPRCGEEIAGSFTGSVTVERTMKSETTNPDGRYTVDRTDKTVGQLCFRRDGAGWRIHSGSWRSSARYVDESVDPAGCRATDTTAWDGDGDWDDRGDARLVTTGDLTVSLSLEVVVKQTFEHVSTGPGECGKDRSSRTSDERFSPVGCESVEIAGRRIPSQDAAAYSFSCSTSGGDKRTATGTMLSW